MTLQNLKEVLTVKIPEKQQEVIAFRKEHGKTKVGEVTVDMVSADRSKIVQRSLEVKTNSLNILICLFHAELFS